MNREEDQPSYHHQKKMGFHQNVLKSCFDDSLYCEEDEKFGDFAGEEESEITVNNGLNLSFFPLQQDLFWDDEELKSLFCKEKETRFKPIETHFFCRKEAVDRILKISSHYGFSPLTAILAVNYLDRFISHLTLPKEKPWMMQLIAVTCLSLAAKVEETHVPLVLDLQVEDAKYLFDAKTLQRMELLVLSSLKWRMNPVTPLSFLDHIMRRLGLKSYVHWEFLRSCENLLLLVISDPRFTQYLPSVLATATMLHVIHQVEPSNAADYENQLLGVLKISKEEVDDCYEIITDSITKTTLNTDKSTPKRKMAPFFTSDNSNDSWTTTSPSSSCICSSSPQNPQLFKKRRVQEQQMKLPSLNTVLLASPH